MIMRMIMMIMRMMIMIMRMMATRTQNDKSNVNYKPKDDIDEDG